MVRFVCILVWVSCLGLALTDERPSRGGYKITCSSPFQAIGDSCLLVDNNMLGNWNDVRTFCKDRGGDSVNLFDANVLHDIALYINNTGVPNSGFWIGAYDLFAEGSWVWSLNNSNVEMDTPLWGVNGINQEPTGGTSQNCAFLNNEYFYYIFDGNCDDFHAALCAAPGTMTEKEEQERDPKFMKATDCPSPYTLLGESCLMVNAIQGSRWDNQFVLCQNMGGQLAQITDANDFAALYDYLALHEISMDLWIGGTDIGAEGIWSWTDATPVPMLTPFWGGSEDTPGTQDPSGGANQNCLGLSSRDFFFFHDFNCDEEKGVICQYFA